METDRRADVTSARSMPKRETRAVHRQLDDLHLLLASEQVLLSAVGHPAVGLRLVCTMRAELIGHFKPCMTEIYLHIDARMADYIHTHP